MNTEKIKDKTERMKPLLYKPISEHDEVWYFGWFGMLNRGKYKVAKRFHSYCFRKKKDAIKFKAMQRELFDDVCNLIDEEMWESFSSQVQKFYAISTDIGACDDFESNHSWHFQDIKPMTIRESLNTADRKLREIVNK